MIPEKLEVPLEGWSLLHTLGQLFSKFGSLKVGGRHLPEFPIQLLGRFLHSQLGWIPSALDEEEDRGSVVRPLTRERLKERAVVRKCGHGRQFSMWL